MVQEIWLKLQETSTIKQGKVGIKAVLQRMEANPASSTQRISGELGISLSRVVRYFHEFWESSGATEFCFTLQNFWLAILFVV